MAALRWFLKLKTPLIIHTTTRYRTFSNKSFDISNNSSKLNSVENLLQTFGFSQTHVNKILDKESTRILGPKTLKPKLEFLLSICNQSEPDVVKIVNRTPHLLRRSLNNHLIPVFDMLKLVTGNHNNAAAAIMSNPFVLTYSISIPLLQNIEFLQTLGVPENQILKFITGYGQVIGKQHDKFCKVVGKVKEMGFDLSSYSFRRAVLSLCLINDETWEAKFEIYRSFGFSDDEIVSMFKKLPAIVAYSEKRIGEVMEFFVKKLGCSPSRLVVVPYVIGFSLEKRTIPRCSVLQTLESKKSISCSSSLYHILAMTECAFLEKFVNAHKDKVPEVMDAYTGKLRFDEYNFRYRGRE